MYLISCFTIQQVVETVEGEMEKVLSNKKGKGNKDQVQLLENRLKKNRWHISKLELV